jgi:hypothetical protein
MCRAISRISSSLKRSNYQAQKVSRLTTRPFTHSRQLVWRRAWR